MRGPSSPSARSARKTLRAATARSVRAAQRLTGLDEREAKKVGGRQTAGGECAHQLGANTPLAWTAPSFFTRISFSPVRLLGSSHSSCTSCGATRDQVQRAWAVHTPGEKRWDRTGKILTKFPEDLSPAPAPTLPAVGGWCYLSPRRERHPSCCRCRVLHPARRAGLVPDHEAGVEVEGT